MSSALDPFDPSWLTRPLRAGIALVDALQLAGALVGLGLFARARRLLWAHWRGLAGKTRLLLAALLLAAPLQLASDACLLAYAKESAEAEAEANKEGSNSPYNYSPLLGAYVILGLMAAACATSATVLLTYLALMDRRGLRWGAGLGLGALCFLFLSIAIAYPGLSRHRGGFLVAWLPYVLALGLWTALFLGGQKSKTKGKQRAHPAVGGSWDGHVALLNDVVAADSSEEDPSSNGNSSSSFDPTTAPHHQPPHTMVTSLPQSLAQWLGFPCALYLGIALLLLLVGLCLGEPEGRVAVGVLLAAVLRGIWPLHLWVAGASIERQHAQFSTHDDDDAARAGSSGAYGRSKEALQTLTMAVAGGQGDGAAEGADAATVHRTLTELLQTTAREILLNPRDLSLGSPIARGGSGVVRRGRLYGAVPVAAKSLYSQYMMGDLEEAIAEAKVLAQLPPHPNVIALYGVCLWPQTNTVYLVMEFAPVTLEEFVLRGDYAPGKGFVAYGQALLDAMAFLHAADIVHRDLKPSNLLLDGKGALKIADMGLAVRASYYDREEEAAAAAGNGGVAGIAGTPLYMAPEVAALPHHTTTSKPQHQPPHQSSNIDPTKGDVYAAALVLWFLLYRRHPLGEYAGQGRHELAAKVTDGTRPPLDGPPAGGGPVPPPLASLLQEMWHPDPRIRPPMAEAARRFRGVVSGGAAAVLSGTGAEEEQPAAVGALPPLLDVGAAAYDKAALSPPAESGDALGAAGAAEAVAAAEAAAMAGAAAAEAAGGGVGGEAFGED